MVLRRTHEGCGGQGENSGAFPNAVPIFPKPFSVPEVSKPWQEKQFVLLENLEGIFPNCRSFPENVLRKAFGTASKCAQVVVKRYLPPPSCRQ